MDKISFIAEIRKTTVKKLVTGDKEGLITLNTLDIQAVANCSLIKGDKTVKVTIE